MRHHHAHAARGLVTVLCRLTERLKLSTGKA
ncbi:hypothetical protein predicted by Glimmer/Critica [Acetobacter senegalensis]|uniref:Uncharacterized protein n=1 Tax=Acetobacter senegalensis TaxID=446692 RepID=A0A0U5BAZ7_9PROT|nr:hypothetical protein predicted by Glimmer/Critica [Acetobacter senegalensis]